MLGLQDPLSLSFSFPARPFLLTLIEEKREIGRDRAVRARRARKFARRKNS